MGWLYFPSWKNISRDFWNLAVSRSILRSFHSSLFYIFFYIRGFFFFASFAYTILSRNFISELLIIVCYERYGQVSAMYAIEDLCCSMRFRIWLLFSVFVSTHIIKKIGKFTVFYLIGIYFLFPYICTLNKKNLCCTESNFFPLNIKSSMQISLVKPQACRYLFLILFL